MQPDHIQLTLAKRAAHLAMKVHKIWSEKEASSSKKQNDLFAIEVKNMTRMHLIYKMYERARANLESSNATCTNLKGNIYKVLANFALNQLKLDSSPLYECGYFGKGSARLLN